MIPLLAGALAAVGLTLPSPTQSVPAQPDSIPPAPIQAEPASTPDALAWQLFTAINQPTRTDRAAAHTDTPLTWETWPTASATFRKDGADPGPWTGGRIGIDRFEGILPSDFPDLRRVENGRMIPVPDPLAAARRLVEVRLNPVSYAFIRDRQLYTVDGQQRAVTAGPVEFPAGSLQLKAGWRPITRQQRSRYHTMTLRGTDGRTRWYGLTALNLAFKTATGAWLWASFEQVDQSPRPAKRSASPARHPEALPDDPASRKRQYYRLRGTQTAYVDASGQPTRLGNAVLEPDLGDSASCMTCHARATLGMQAESGRLAVFAPAPPGIRRGYVGQPDPDWFGQTDAQGRRQTTFAQLDFVWSLAQAAPRNSAASSTGQSP